MKNNVHHLLMFLILSFSSLSFEYGMNSEDYYKNGITELRNSNYNIALSNLLKFIQVEELKEEPDKIKLLNGYTNIGSVHNLFSDFEQAIYFYNKAIKMSIELNDQDTEFTLLNNLIGIYCDLNQIKLANEYNEKIPLLSNVEIGLREAYYVFNKGYIAKSNGDDKTLIENMECGISYLDKYELNQEEKVYPYQEIFLAYERKGDYSKALEMLDKYYELSLLANQQYYIIECYKSYMRIYTKIGKIEKALLFQNKYFSYSDSLLNIRDFMQVRKPKDIAHITIAIIDMT